MKEPIYIVNNKEGKVIGATWIGSLKDNLLAIIAHFKESMLR